jgi:hypothetical protein
LLDRLIRAASFNKELYEEIEADKSALTQAILIVVVVSISKGIAALTISGDFLGLILGMVFGLLSWSVWAFITYFVGTKILPSEATHSSWGELARVTGFAQTPGVLFFLAAIPVVGLFIGAFIAFWQLGAMVVGIRQALDYTSTIRAVGVVLIGFVPVMVLNALLA